MWTAQGHQGLKSTTQACEESQAVDARAPAAGGSSRESRKLKIAWEWAPPIGRGGRSRRGSVAAVTPPPLQSGETVSPWYRALGPGGAGGAGRVARRRRGMRRHAGATPRPRRRARTPGAETLQALRRYDNNARCERPYPFKATGRSNFTKQIIR